MRLWERSPTQAVTSNTKHGNERALTSRYRVASGLAGVIPLRVVDGATSDTPAKGSEEPQLRINVIMKTFIFPGPRNH